MTGPTITLPFPPASLSGHAKGHWRDKHKATKQWRELAHALTLKAGTPDLPDTGDILLHIRFVPPDRRGDRQNYPNRLKAALDGIADAWGVNDKRFLPVFEFEEPEAPGRVEVTLA